MSRIRAVLWDFGGVLSTSPFDAFSAYERANGLEPGFLRRLNATNPDTNAWARFERSQLSFEAFCAAYEAEAAAAGGAINATEVMACLSGELRPEMFEAIRRCRAAGLKTALLTNNVPSMHDRGDWSAGLGIDLDDLFDVVVESSKEGVRKPDVAAYELVCTRLGVSPDEVVFLDDLGINLKPARAMGMTTIKVVDTDDALAELETAVGLILR